MRLAELLADITPPWILTGGAALAGFHTGHRSTRDLDLRWPQHDAVADVALTVSERLRSANIAFEVLQTSPMFERLRVHDADDVVLVDLVADPVPSVEPPQIVALGHAQVRIDTPHEILVNKLCALLGRMELRDLEDVRALLSIGGQLDRALADAPRKDGGFSTLTLAWLLRGMPADRLARSAGWIPEDADEIERFKSSLIEHLVEAAAPQ